MDVSKLLCSIIAVLSLDAQLELMAQVGQSIVGPPNAAVLGNLPQATAQAPAAGSVLIRPQTGLTDAQWNALKEQATKFPDPNGRSPTEGVLSPSPVR
jgi:hypothetical protein